MVMDKLLLAYQMHIPHGSADFAFRRSNEHRKTIPFYRLSRWSATSFFPTFRSQKRASYFSLLRRI